MKILLLHQSPDLYGSDRVFLQVVKFLKISGRFSLITVVLPRTGPLVDELLKIGVETRFMSMSLLSKTYLKNLQFGKIIIPLLSFFTKKRLLEKYDYVYANTSVILDFYVLAPFLKNKKIIHIHEIPASWLAKMISVFILKSDAKVIFNSQATRKSFPNLKNMEVIYNAFDGFNATKPPVDLFGKSLNILLIGRINDWKGQDFAIKALSKIKNEKFVLRIVGSTSEGNESMLTDLKGLVKNLEMDSLVEFVNFVEDTTSMYLWSDVIIVPSKKPEPFGIITIEAMSLGIPVIAADHGGLSEIVVNNETGYLFKPNNELSFNNSVKNYLADRFLLKLHGEKSKQRHADLFSVATFNLEIKKLFINTEKKEINYF